MKNLELELSSSTEKRGKGLLARVTDVAKNIARKTIIPVAIYAAMAFGGGCGDDTGGNNAPVFDPVSNQSVDEANPLSFQVHATDADGDAITYSASNLPAGASFDSGTRTFSWTPTFSQSGNYNPTFHANDGKTTTNKVVPVTVNDVADPQASLVATPNSGEVTLSVTLDASGSTSGLTITQYDFDFDGDGFDDYSETQASAPDGTFDGISTVDYAIANTYIPRVRITDSASRTNTATTTITVTNPALPNISRDICTDAKSSRPRIVAAPDGTLHVLWNSNNSGDYEIYHSKSTDKGDTWSAPANISNDATRVDYIADAAVDSTGRLHTIWWSKGSSDGKLMYKLLDGTWQTSEEIDSATNTNTMWNSIAVDSANNPHVVWNDNISGNKIWYSTESGSGWDTPVQISVNRDPLYPSISIDSSNNPFVVWEDYVAPNTVVTYTHFNGSTWDTPQDVSHSAENRFKPKVVIDPLDFAQVVWFNGSDEVYHSEYDIQSPLWSTPQNISNSAEASRDPSITLDSFGAPQAVWRERLGSTSNDNEVYHSGFDGSWSTPQNISNTSTTWSGNTSIAVTESGGNEYLNVVWEDGTYNSSTEPYSIKYRRQKQ